MNPILNVQYWTLDRFVPYKRKLRNNDRAVESMVANLATYGFRVPLLVRENGEVIDGDLRLKAAQKLGLPEVPVIVCDDWTEQQVRAFRLAVNRSATWADFNLEVVTLELQELKALNFDLKLTGFAPLEIDRMLFKNVDLPGLGLPGPGGDGKPTTEKGDLWLCCGHRILCGDATLPENVSALLGDAKPVLMLTDPPYGVEYDPDWRTEADLGEQRQTGKVANDDRVDWAAAYELFPGDVAYVWHAGVHAGEVAASLIEIGFEIRAQIIWAKQHFALSRGDYHWQHEPCWYAVRKGKSSNWSGDRTQSTLWQVPNLNPFGGDRQEEATGHGAQKPVEVIRRPILNNTRVGESVYDPFLGSGTTLEALDFVAQGKVKTIVETYPLTEAPEAYQRVAEGKARFRAVLTM